MVKNRWVKVRYQGKEAYAQWEDCGPSLTDDTQYVFGTAKPKNTNGVHSGLDLSPAVALYLDAVDAKGGWLNPQVDWQFVDAPAPGPWTSKITTSQTDWR